MSSLDRRREFPKEMLSPRNVERFSTAVRAQFRNPNSRLRKAYVCQFGARVDVSDREIRISDPKIALHDGLAGERSNRKGQVPSLGREWWARQDSNLRPDRYERPALTN